MKTYAECNEVRELMTTQDQDAVFGRLMRERQELEQKRSALEAEAERLSSNLIALGKALRHPDRVALETEELLPDFDSAANPAHRVSLSELEEVNKIIPLARDYRETVTNIRKKALQLEAFGWTSR